MLNDITTIERYLHNAMHFRMIMEGQLITFLNVENAELKLIVFYDFSEYVRKMFNVFLLAI